MFRCRGRPAHSAWRADRSVCLQPLLHELPQTKVSCLFSASSDQGSNRGCQLNSLASHFVLPLNEEVPGTAGAQNG